MADIQPKTVTVRKRRWRLYTCKLSKKVCGEADPPTEKGKEVRISDKLAGQEMLDTIIHELFHCGHWDIDETVVEEFATDVARVLWGLGYRAPWDSKDVT